MTQETKDSTLTGEQKSNKANNLVERAYNLIYGVEPDLNQAKKLLETVITEEQPTFLEQENKRFFSFNSPIEFILYCNINKPTKACTWLSINYSKAYYLLAYIYNEEENYEEALKALNQAMLYNPADVNNYFEESETYKLEKDWNNMYQSLMFAYRYIYDKVALARFYRSLGYYYIEMKKLDIAYALYTLSLMYDQKDSAYHEMDYIKTLLGDSSFNMPEEDALKIIKLNNIPSTIDQTNITTLENVFNNPKNCPPNSPIYNLLKRILNK